MTATTEARSEDALAFTITRTFEAPRELVWRAWTRAEMAANWWGPKGYVTTRCEMDVRVGGRYRHTMRSPENTLHTKQGEYRVVEPPSRLVLTYAWADEAGRPKHEMLVTVTFAEDGPRTRLTLHHEHFESATARDLHEGGWTSCLDRFADYLSALTKETTHG